MRLLLAITLISLCVSCDFFKSQQPVNPILAEAEGRTLRLSDVENIFYPGISSRDSLELLKNYVYNWTRKCVMAAKAEQLLDKSQLDVSKELEDYRMSLLAYRYEMQRLSQELDTVITNDELMSYNEQNPSDIPVSSKPQVKVVYLKLRQNAENSSILKMALIENRDRQYLDSLCTEMKVQPDYMGNQWFEIDAMPPALPFAQEQYSFAIKNNIPMIEAQNGGFLHLLSFREVKKKPDTPPVIHLKTQYFDMIMNQRKINLLKKIETEVYNEALDHQRLKIYLNE